MTSASAQADIERIFVALDGSLKCVYTDNSLLVLSSTGASFTLVSAQGQKTVQLTQCCLNRWKDVVAQLLSFRNLHVDIPYIPPWLQQRLQQQGLLFTTGYPVTDTTWAPTAEAAVEHGLVKLCDAHRIQCFSTCGSAYITLRPHGLCFAACYPLLLNHDSASNTFTYVQHTQVFSCNQYPPRWKTALSVAVAAASLVAESFQKHTGEQPQAQQPTRQPPEPEHSLLVFGVHASACNPTARARCAAGDPEACKTSARSVDACIGSPPLRPPHGCSMEAVARPELNKGLADHDSSHAHRCTDDLASGISSPCQPAVLDTNTPADNNDGVVALKSPWHPPGSPGSPMAAFYAVAEHQQLLQRGLQSNEPWPARQSAAAPAIASKLDSVVQLPVMPGATNSLPRYSSDHQQQRQQQQGRQFLKSSQPAQQTGSVLDLGAWHTDATDSVASALAQAPWQRQHGSLDSSMSSWWLEPHLLLPVEELVCLVWCPESTCIFLMDMDEVEVWLHADDSWLFSFQGGKFLAHSRAQTVQDSATAAAAAAPCGSVCAEAAERTGPQIKAPLGPCLPASSAGDLALGPPTAPQDPAAAPPVCEATSTKAGVPDLQHTPLPTYQAHTGDVGEIVHSATPQSAVVRVYPSNSIPADFVVPARAEDGSRLAPTLPLGRVAVQALKLRSVMVRVKASMATTLQRRPAAVYPSPGDASLSNSSSSEQPQQAALSVHVVEQQDVPGAGQFTAYADGRVRVVFGDRTLLSLDAAQVQAVLILPDGSRREVPVSKAFGVEQYVQAALEFAAWCSHTPVARAAALRMQALVAAELRSSARMAAICEWGSNPKCVPAAFNLNSRPSRGSMQAVVKTGNSLTEDDGWASCEHGYGQGAGVPTAVHRPSLPPCAIEKLLHDNRTLIERL